MQKVGGEHHVPYAGRTQRGLLLVTLQPPVSTQIFKVGTPRAGRVSLRAFGEPCPVSLVLSKQPRGGCDCCRRFPFEDATWPRSLPDTSLEHRVWQA